MATIRLEALSRFKLALSAGHIPWPGRVRASTTARSGAASYFPAQNTSTARGGDCHQFRAFKESTTYGRIRTRNWLTVPRRYAISPKGVSTCLDHTLHVVVGPRTPSHELTVRHGIDLYGVLKQAVEQQSTRP